MNIIGLIQSGEIQAVLSNETFDAFCEEIEQEFKVAKGIKTNNSACYELGAGVNGMRWAEAAGIEVLKTDQGVTVKYSINTVTTTVICLIISFGFFVFQNMEKHEPIFGILPFLILMPVSLLLSLLAFRVFKFRLNNLVNRAASLNFSLSKEQQSWINDPARCPACGYNVNGSETNCPDCGLRLN